MNIRIPHTAIVTLLEQGHRVRAMVRNLDARADRLRDIGAEVVVADMLDIIAVRATAHGPTEGDVIRGGHDLPQFPIRS